MHTIALRILLGILLLFGIATCLMAKLNDAVLLNLPSVYGELADEATSPDRHAELIDGLRRRLASPPANQQLNLVGRPGNSNRRLSSDHLKTT